jgi:hypothetical protein
MRCIFQTGWQTVERVSAACYNAHHASDVSTTHTGHTHAFSLVRGMLSVRRCIPQLLLIANRAKCVHSLTPARACALHACPPIHPLSANLNASTRHACAHSHDLQFLVVGEEPRSLTPLNHALTHAHTLTDLPHSISHARTPPTHLTRLLTHSHTHTTISHSLDCSHTHTHTHTYSHHKLTSPTHPPTPHPSGDEEVAALAADAMTDSDTGDELDPDEASALTPTRGPDGRVYVNHRHRTHHSGGAVLAVVGGVNHRHRSVDAVLVVCRMWGCGGWSIRSGCGDTMMQLW